MMVLKDFLKKYDLPGSVVLLEGKRIVPDQDIPKLIKLGKILAEQSEHILFRSGNAPGADYYFSQGVTDVDHSLLHVITPYAGHRKKENKAYSTISLDDINLANEPEVVYQTTNKKNKTLVDQYVSGKRDRISKLQKKKHFSISNTNTTNANVILVPKLEYFIKAILICYRRINIYFKKNNQQFISLCQKFS